MRGIWPILYAYFDSGDQLDRVAMRRQIEVAIAGGAPGIAILGLATEIGKLADEEKGKVIAWAAEDLAAGPGLDGRLVVTINGASADAQLALSDIAIAHGACALILQPPARASGPLSEIELLDFFDLVMAKLAERAPQLAIGVQNAPEFLGVGLGFDALIELRRRRSNFRFLKGEAPSVIIERTIAQAGGAWPVLNGRGGLELLDNLRAGCAGMILAPDTCHEQQLIAAHLAAGRVAEAEAEYARILPAIVFVMQSLDTLVVYGKRIAAWRMGFDVQHDRRVAFPPTAFGLAAARRYADALGPLPGCRLHHPA